jgi:uncharacterized protein (DUF488 family)
MNPVGALLTVGHGTHPAEEFVELLRGAGVRHLVDIRIGPGSRRNPQFQRAALQEWLPAAGIGYQWEQRLGGFRKLPPDSPDVALRNDSFRAYAAHMRTDAFRAAIDALLANAVAVRTVVMCSESVWWRCHRRLVADAVALLHGWHVQHLMPDGRLVDHPPTDGVRMVGPDLVYDVVPENDQSALPNV